MTEQIENSAQEPLSLTNAELVPEDRWHVVQPGENLTAIIEEILTLASLDDTIIRLQTYDNPYVNLWKEQGIFDDLKPSLDQWNQQIIDIGAQYGIPVANVYHEFNGPDGDQDTGEKGYLAEDGMHNNDEGARRIAEILRRLGYAPLAP